MKSKVFWGVTPCNLVDVSDVSEEAVAFFFWLEILKAAGRVFPRNASVFVPVVKS